ncbi:MAG: energy transducer TonB [Methylacidiphilales bacterium]|nr:energy transducer TonB [Candidatus Methylacidiphilales bacterium]
MSDFNYDEEDEPSFLQKYRFVIVALVVLFIAGGVALVFHFFSGTIPPPRKPQEITISLPPPPPPPPPIPPPKTPPPPEQKMVEQPPIKPNEVKPKDMVKSDKAPGPPGPKASGPPSDDGIGGNGNGDGGIGGDGYGSRFGWYGGIVQQAVHQALTENDKTRFANIHHLRVRIWIDSAGRVTRATLSGSSGDPSLDDALKNNALTSVRLSQPPPSDMPMPVVMTIDEERPQ